MKTVAVSRLAMTMEKHPKAYLVELLIKAGAPVKWTDFLSEETILMGTIFRRELENGDMLYGWNSGVKK